MSDDRCHYKFKNIKIRITLINDDRKYDHFAIIYIFSMKILSVPHKICNFLDKKLQHFSKYVNYISNTFHNSSDQTVQICYKLIFNLTFSFSLRSNFMKKSKNLRFFITLAQCFSNNVPRSTCVPGAVQNDFTFRNST